MGTVVYNTVSKALVTFDEDAGSALVTQVTFGQRIDSIVLNRYQFQFTGGGGGGPTMAIEAQGPTGAWSPYTNAAGDAATGIAASTAYIVDTGIWLAFRVTWTGSDGSAVLSVLGYQAEAGIPALEARVAELEAAVVTLTPQMTSITVTVVPDDAAEFIGVPFDSGTVTAARYTAAVAGTSAAGAITVALKRLDNDAVICAATSIDGQTDVVLTVGTGAFAGGVYAEVVSDNADAVEPIGAAVHVEYDR